ncbi:4-hydroxythreonine-4-phosphate dehydrogenase PdxA [Qipengyuania atrilutea]|uniref:4-hydroxythreonine-4-phosphate dehydrogenase n=1 Tax=Qipengyuania atrilutea TaxID=2744473 RepID=A0A850GZ09_9SPHN|nr:4-hydroxythreonine-4-phosphate dehydrogenase PdxA [Actirhodobacter atriluteus]NVD43617.1 4-hydroxythreonine-4-phosphate dehydrogenase PdxA [Actirhodobacter atriluteus]
MNSLPLAISLGDPAGVGPELIVRCWQTLADTDCGPIAVVGGANVLRRAAERIGIDLPLAQVDRIADAALHWSRALPVLDMADATYTPGEPTADGARLALASLQAACGLARSGEAAALVTAPVAKDNLVAAGFAHPGQTEFLADRCGIAPEDAVMMLAGPRLRTVPITVHVALSEVPGRLTSEKIHRRTAIAAKALQRDFGIAEPRIAIAGLNPHASENGRFGSEEAEIITPAIRVLRDDGHHVTGPHPGDALFTPRARETYDVAVCMYHDQALIPLKALDFDEGVNVTLGLPIVRTSPDHGTAFDIAGEGIADPGAMLAAIRMASDCAARRRENESRS